MPFGAHVYAHLEDALSECFEYHAALDAFIRRAGVPVDRVLAARKAAELRAKESQRAFARAPKRYVVQELLKDLEQGGDANDRLTSNLITALCKGNFASASATARAAVASLIGLRIAEREERAEQQAEKREADRIRERQAEKESERAAQQKAKRRDELRDTFLQLCAQQDKQARGYMLEKFLNDLFSFEGLDPRGSFKLVGEQIDGSFAWSGRTYLVEARWVNERVGGAGFSGLIYKIEGKTADTRGLFVSINGYSPEALIGLGKKGELRFACIDGAHLMRCLEPGGSFVRLLEAIWRHASETGEPYLPVSKMGH